MYLAATKIETFIVKAIRLLSLQRPSGLKRLALFGRIKVAHHFGVELRLHEFPRETHLCLDRGVNFRIRLALAQVRVNHLSHLSAQERLKDLFDPGEALKPIYQ